MRMRMPIILETFIGDLAKIEKRTISFDVSAVCFSLHGTIKISLDGFSLIKVGFRVIFKTLPRRVNFH